MTEDARSRLRAAPYGYTTGLVPGVTEAAAALRDVLWDPAGAVSTIDWDLVGSCISRDYSGVVVVEGRSLDEGKTSLAIVRGWQS